MESGIHSVESGIQDSLGLPYMGRKNTISESDISAVNFIVSWKWFALVTNSLILSSFCVPQTEDIVNISLPN